MSLGKYAWSQSEDVIYSHLYVGGSAEFDQAAITVESRFPWEGEVSYTVEPKQEDGRFTLAIRIPSYVGNSAIKNSVKSSLNILLNGNSLENAEEKDGYLYIMREWHKGDRVDISFEMIIRRIYCNTKVRENENCVALMRGPIVYCFEGVDNGADIQELRIPQKTEVTAAVCEEGVLKGMMFLKMGGVRMQSSQELYSEQRPEPVPVQLTAVPYFAWGNRGENQMRVWMPEV